MGYLYILATVLFTIYGQIILKWRLNMQLAVPNAFFEKILYFIKMIIIDPFILSGFISAFVASIFWMMAMSKFDVSHAYPIVVGGLAILTSLFAVVILKESASFYKILGLFLIVFGVYFLSKGNPID